MLGRRPIDALVGDALAVFQLGRVVLAGAELLRAGLQVADLRYAWLPVPPGTSGPFARAELGYQINNANSFPMRAWAGRRAGPATAWL